MQFYLCYFRAMAICISLMMGRLGSVVGANIVGQLLDNYCQLAFLLSGSSLISNYNSAYFEYYGYLLNYLNAIFSVCGFLAILIPNITQRALTQQPQIPMESRHSICSHN